ncbi:hypothetical protein ScPMuIL_018802 [Solemya velum]
MLNSTTHMAEDSFGLFESVLWILNALDNTQKTNDANSGYSKQNILNYMKNVSFTSPFGLTYVDSNFQRSFQYSLWDYTPDKLVEEIIYMEKDKNNEIHAKRVGQIAWAYGQDITADLCFKKTDCENTDINIPVVVGIVLGTVVFATVVFAVATNVWRNIKKREMVRGPNKIFLTTDDLVFLQRKDIVKGSKVINNSLVDKPDLLKASEKPNRSMGSLHEYYDFSETARYNGDLVHVKELKIKGFELKNKMVGFIKTLREVRHENVNAVIGFLNESMRPALVNEYCSRGSLDDVLKNTDIKLDWDFKVSLITDLVRGIRYIHNSNLRWHGNLKSRNCVIDSRWVLKVTDFGISGFLDKMKAVLDIEAKDLLWTAPEHLRDLIPMKKGSDKGDVFSFAIIMQQVILRSEPYSTTGLSPEDIIRKVKHPPPLLRPSVSAQAAPPQYIQLMKQCWTENPDMRPSVEEIYHQFKTFTGGKKMNIVDTMFRMLEKYSNDLEDIVRERTTQLEEEKKKTDNLLFRMLPATVAESLKMGTPVEAESYSEVTIYFSDIVGFTTISAMSTPIQVVDLLNDLYTMFDATIDVYDVYKVETIGDAYMVVSGLPLRNGSRHAGEIGTMALDLLSQCGSFTIRHMPEVPLRLRIGLHTGPCVTGVVGLTMPRYCLFGDTVNTASRMESSGSAFRIHISHFTKEKLDELTGYLTEYRGETEIKGKGFAKTYWLIGKEGFNKVLPVPPDQELASLLSERKISVMAKERSGLQSPVGSTPLPNPLQSQTQKTTVDVEIGNSTTPHEVHNLSKTKDDNPKSVNEVSNSSARTTDNDKAHPKLNSPRKKISDGVVGVSVGTGTYSPPTSPSQKVVASVNTDSEVITHKNKEKSFKRMVDGGTKKNTKHRNNITHHGAGDLKHSNSKIDRGKSNLSPALSPKTSYGMVTGESVISSSDCTVSVIADDNGNNRVEYHNQLPPVSER